MHFKGGINYKIRVRSGMIQNAIRMQKREIRNPDFMKNSTILLCKRVLSVVTLQYVNICYCNPL